MVEGEEERVCWWREVDREGVMVEGEEGRV